ncbi:MAG: FkbM family methyltransferase [Terriglobales bacterium]
MAFESLSDLLLGFYGSFAVPHRGRDRIVAMMSAHACRRWTGLRSFRRRGLRLRTDLSVDDVGRILYAYGCLDYWDEKALRGLVPRNGVAVDVGAHIGFYSLLLARLAGPAGMVFSYEPVPYTYALLRANLRRNAAANVVAQPVAVGAHPASVRMAPAPGGRLGWSRVDVAGELAAPATTLDAEVERFRIGRVDFIKVDVEGYEMEVMTGAQMVLRRFRPVVMYEINPQALAAHGVNQAALTAFFRERGYATYRAGRKGLTPSEHAAEGTYSNAFAIPRPMR